MKKIIASILCLILMTGCFSAFAQEESVFYSTVEFFTYFHGAFFYDDPDFTFNGEYPLYRINENNYDNMEVYTTPNGELTFLFHSDKTGDNISAISVIGSADYFKDGSVNGDYYLFTEMFGLLYLYTYELMESDPDCRFVSDIKDLYEIAYKNIYSGSFVSTEIGVGNFATMISFVEGDSLGLIITFTTPITMDFMLSRLDLLDNILDN